jgi:hypothetical protein
MAEIATSASHERVQLSFFFWMAVAMAAVIYGGFGLSYFAPMAAGTLRPVAPVVHFHGVFYFSWMILLIAQTLLIGRGNVPMHRSMGMLGIMVATGLVIFGAIVTVLSTKTMMDSPAGMPDFGYGLMWLSTFALVNFGVLFALAIRNIRNSDAHKRYILLATAAFIGAGVNRFISLALGLEADEFSPFWMIDVFVDVFVVAIVAYDVKTLGRPHPATITGAALILGSQILLPLVEHSGWWMNATHWMANLSG